MHIYSFKLRTFKILFLVVLVVVMLGVNINGNIPASVYFGNSLRKVPIYYVDTDEKKVAISFDAAWGADKTEKIMEICKEYDSNATFFLVGFWVEDYPEVAKKIAENGFEIGTHSNTHPDMTKLSKSAQLQELETSCKIIEQTTGKKPTLFRAPFGAYNDNLLENATSLGLKTIQWDVDTLDWKGLSGIEIVNRVLNSVKSGSIILCHNNSDHILDALPILLDRLHKKGYKVTNVGDVVLQNDYIIDNNGMQTAKI